MTITRKIHSGWPSSARLRRVVVTTPRAKKILKTLKDSTLPGKSAEITAPRLV